MVKLWHHSSFHMVSHSTRMSSSSACRRLYWPDWVHVISTTLGQTTKICALSQNRSQSCLWENFCDHTIPNTWLSNSADSNLLDYYLFGAIERETNKTPYSTKDEQKARITTAFSIRKACWKFRSRLEATVNTNNLLSYMVLGIPIWYKLFYTDLSNPWMGP